MTYKHRRNRVRSAIGTFAIGLAVGAALSIPQNACAQSIDSLTAALSSDRVLDRGFAVGTLARLPVPAIPGPTRDALIALLEREGLGTEARVMPPPDSLDDTNEAWGEYIGGLTNLVLKFSDSQALRGMTLLGIQTSRAAQSFVAGFGGAALAPLAEAWATKPTSRGSVIMVWALLAKTADSATKTIALQRLLAPDDTFAIDLASAATAGNLVALVPLLDSLSHSPSLRAGQQAAAADAANALRTQYASLGVADLLAMYDAWMGAICLNAAGALQGYCESSENGLDNSTKHLLKGSLTDTQNGQNAQARQELQTIIDRTVNAVASGVLTSWQGTLLITGLRAASARIPA